MKCSIKSSSLLKRSMGSTATRSRLYSTAFLRACRTHRPCPAHLSACDTSAAYRTVADCLCCLFLILDFACIVAEVNLAGIRVQILLADVVMYSINAPVRLPEVALERVGVNLSSHPNTAVTCRRVHSSFRSSSCRSARRSSCTFSSMALCRRSSKSSGRFKGCTEP